MDWYPWYPILYEADTLHLSLAADGAYRRLIDKYMISGRALPDDDAALARLVGVQLDEWLKVSGEVREFFYQKDGCLKHKRCDRELAEQMRRKRQKSESGKKGAKVTNAKLKKTKSNSAPAAAVPRHMLGTGHNITEQETKTARASARPTLQASLDRSLENFRKSLSANQKPKPNGSANGAASSVGAILGISEDLRPSNGPDYDNPEVRKDRWKQKLHNYMIQTLGLESNFVSELWERYDQGEKSARDGINKFSEDMKLEEAIKMSRAARARRQEQRSV